MGEAGRPLDLWILAAVPGEEHDATLEPRAFEPLEDVDYDTEGGGTKFDRMTISEYLDGLGAPYQRGSRVIRTRPEPCRRCSPALHGR